MFRTLVQGRERRQDSRGGGVREGRQAGEEGRKVGKAGGAAGRLRRGGEGGPADGEVRLT